MNECVDLFQTSEPEPETSENDDCVDLYDTCINAGIDTATCTTLLLDCIEDDEQADGSSEDSSDDTGNTSE